MSIGNQVCVYMQSTNKMFHIVGITVSTKIMTKTDEKNNDRGYVETMQVLTNEWYVEEFSVCSASCVYSQASVFTKELNISSDSFRRPS